MAALATIDKQRACEKGLRGGRPCQPRAGLRILKIREVIALIEKDGWRQVRTTGSHRQFKHHSKPGLVTVVGKPSLDVPPGTLRSILKQAGLES